MLSEQDKRKLSVKLEDAIWEFLHEQSEYSDIHFSPQDDNLGTRMADAAMAVLIHSDEIQQWLKEQGYLKDD